MDTPTNRDNVPDTKVVSGIRALYEMVPGSTAKIFGPVIKVRSKSLIVVSAIACEKHTLKAIKAKFRLTSTFRHYKWRNHEITHGVFNDVMMLPMDDYK
jgi:hypothetical protein